MSDRSLRLVAVVVLVAVCLVFAALPAMAGGRKVKVRVEPVYPLLARQNRIEGTVRIQVTVTANGAVKSTKVLGGHALLIEASVEALKQWQYQPAPAETSELIEFNFFIHSTH